MELAPQYLTNLPHDKKYHLFVCHEERTVDVVRKLVENLESMGIICCYSERDFQSGRSIISNISEAIIKSVHMLVVLSENFEESEYCMDEVDKALNRRNRGQYNVIPIKIEPCSIPICLEHLTCIDAANDIDNAHKKIIQNVYAIDKKETQECEITNGELLKFKVQPNKPWWFSLTNYKLNFSETDKAKMRKKPFQLAENILDDIVETANNSQFFQYYHYWDYRDYGIYVIFFLLSTIPVLVYTDELPEIISVMSPRCFVMTTCFVAVLSVFVLGCYMGSGDDLRNQACETLRDNIWKISQQTCNETGVIFYLYGSNSFEPEQISVNFMRYNFKPCKIFFAERLDVDDDLSRCCRDTETKEECTDRLFNDYLRRKARQLEISSRNTKRHRMSNEAKCVCLLVEEWQKE